jgi:hypothetical protein
MRNYSRRELYALGETFGDSSTYELPGRKRIYGGGGSKGGGHTTSTTTTSNIPDWLRPQAEALLGAGTQELFEVGEDGQITGTRPYTPYSTNAQDYVAGFSPLQQQVQMNAANLQVPQQFQQGTQLAGAAGRGGLQSAQAAYGYGSAGHQSGMLGQQLGVQGGQRYGGMGVQSGMLGQQLGVQGGQQYGDMGAGYGARAADIGIMGLRAEELGRDITGQSRGYSQQQANVGQMYENLATSPYEYERYMSPYQQAVVDQQVDAARRQSDISRTQRQASAVRAGAFGGSRQAIEEAEAERGLQSNLSNIQAQGLQSAYGQAQQNILNRVNLEAQGLGGAQSGLGTALQGGSLGLQGIGQAISGQQAGMQGAQTGLQGVQAQLAGTSQGMQGAQVGLQGVSGAQAGYGMANQSAGILGQLGTQQLGAQGSILRLQNEVGSEQREREHQLINQSIHNYAQEQAAPMAALQEYSSLLRGYAAPGQTTSQYQAAPSSTSQLLGAGTFLTGLSGQGRKRGGLIKDSGGGIEKLALRKAMSGGRK